MRFYLQYGYGMGDMSTSLIGSWDGETAVIMSPRDQTPDSLIKLSKSLIKKDAYVLIDPQMYDVAISNNGKNNHYDYWPDPRIFPSGATLRKCIEELVRLNKSISADEIIIPGELSRSIDPKWRKQQLDIRNVVSSVDLKGLNPIYTLAISPEVLTSNAATNSLLSEVDGWEGIKSIYLILKHPNNEYLLDSATWLSNALDIVAGLRLKGIEVIVGYCSHQQLVMAAAGANAICSGTWLNVRAFCLEKFKKQPGAAQRSTWYYAPQLLTEFKIDALDVAHKHGQLNLLASSTVYGSIYADALFKGPQPSLAGTLFNESSSFKHYLCCLRTQAYLATKNTYKETFEHLHAVLNNAETQLKYLHKLGVSGQQRDFLQYVLATRNALDSLNSIRGSILSRNWASIRNI